MNILVTGSEGFIGQNLCVLLKSKGFSVMSYDINKSEDDLIGYINSADFVIHLAGINRPLNYDEFYNGNTNFTKRMVDLIVRSKKSIPILFSSSTQAELDSDYGKSKRMAEEYLFEVMEKTNLPVIVYRLTNVFGKWCRPNYNSVVATFCHNIACDLPIEIRDKDYIIKLVYVDDVVKEFMRCVSERKTSYTKEIREVGPTYSLSLGSLADRLYGFKNTRKSLFMPNFETDFDRKLYATFLSYYGIDKLSYNLGMNNDDRGSFTELFKTLTNGQISVNVSKPGITKGNHYHHTKNEKFVVVNGKCEIKFRKIGTKDVYVYQVEDSEIQVIDIPPGYAHSIKNIGITDSVTIIWASDIYDKENPDTYYEEVEKYE
ncbi:MAG: NAD-dependent epimerase/dehydratase family protein [Bacilli bacterium]|jgi:UDP-2-acetamido-2,6-beta-L-arabino-hexul-4-ose reductase